MNRSIKQAKAKGDPFCVTSKKRVFGPYSQLLPIKDLDEECIEVMSIEAVRYNQLIAETCRSKRELLCASVYSCGCGVNPKNLSS